MMASASRRSQLPPTWPRISAKLLSAPGIDGASMPPLTPLATEPDIQAWCAGYLRKALKLPDTPIDEHTEFSSLGLDSAESVFFVAAIEDWLGLDLASDTAMEHPTLAQLARFVAGRLGAGSPSAQARR
jgi:acyl carrier protein